MKPLLAQIKERRLELGLKQKDMTTRIGISRQQYQRLESSGNPRLETLEAVVTGLNSRLMLVPNDKVSTINALLNLSATKLHRLLLDNQDNYSDDPWRGLLEEDE